LNRLQTIKPIFNSIGEFQIGFKQTSRFSIQSASFKSASNKQADFQFNRHVLNRLQTNKPIFNSIGKFEIGVKQASRLSTRIPCFRLLRARIETSGIHSLFQKPRHDNLCAR
jgi:hypothetical protein